jgi:hypothetical protein
MWTTAGGRRKTERPPVGVADDKALRVLLDHPEGNHKRAFLPFNDPPDAREGDGALPAPLPGSKRIGCRRIVRLQGFGNGGKDALVASAGRRKVGWFKSNLVMFRPVPVAPGMGVSISVMAALRPPPRRRRDPALV